MALSVGELVAYLKLDDSQYRQGLSAVERNAIASLRGQERAMGESGTRQASALTSKLKTGIVAGATAAGAAGAAAFGTALKLGFDRLTAIDDAKGKLRGLGHDTAAQAKIMESALASVKGTAFGLGDAATISASAIAAGIKPGQELTKYLKSTADAATIAGSSLSDMGSIFNKVQTGGAAMTDDLNQLADRGIPIYQWLGKEMKVAAGEVKDLAAEGKVSSEIFMRAINNNIAGAALQSGKTVTGSFNNVKAALGRLGAAALEPGFNRLPVTFTAITAAIDSATPKVKSLATAFDAKVFGDWAPAAQNAWREVAGTPAVRENLAEVKGLITSLGQTAQSAWPPLVQIGSSLAQASGALGVSTWRLFLTALEAAAGALNIVVGTLQPIASLMSNHQGAVTAAVGAWLLFKTVPGILANLRVGMASVAAGTTAATGPMQQLGRGIANVQTGVRNLGSGLSSARGGISNFTQSYRDLVRWTGQANSTISPMGRILFGTGEQARTASTHIRAMGSVASSVASSGMNALKAGATGVVGALGGPFSAALMAAGVAFALISAKNQKAAQSMQAYEQATKNVARAQIELNEALINNRGSETAAEVKSAAKDRIEALRSELEAAGNRTGSVWDRVWRRGDRDFFEKNGGVQKTDTSRAKQIEMEAQSAKEAKAALDGLKLTQQSLADVTYGSAAAFAAMVSKLEASGQGGKDAAVKLREARAEFLNQQAVTKKLTPGIAELSKAMQVLGDKTATAADKSNALKTALDALNPARTLGDAIAAHDKTLQQIAQSSQEAADKTKGFGTELIGVGGAINTTKANGNELRDALKGIVDASVEAAAKGQPVAEVNAKNADAFKQLAAQYGLTVEQVQQAYNTLGGKDITMIVKLAGAPEAVQKMAEVARAFETTPDAKTITLRTNDIAGIQDQLRKLGFTVTDLPDGTTTITANTDAAKKQLAEIQRVITADIPSDKPINVSTPGGQAVYDLLKSMGVEVTTNNDKNIKVESPLAPQVLELLKQLGIQVTTNNDKTISIKQTGADAVQDRIRELIKPETKVVTIRQAIEAGAGIGTQLPNGQVFRGPGIANNANGSIVPMAEGGLRQITKPTSAGIYAGRGAGTIFAEQETGGEAYIPLASGKRDRSLSILAEVARMFGVALVNPIQAFADGGLRTAAAVNAFPRTGGLEGAKYVFGGVNWGDCSGAMSAIANFAVGLAPFASRFATASEGAELAKRGFKSGRGPAGSLRFGWVNGGPGGGHTAGTLPDGTNVEMGGARGNGQVGGKAAGADDPQFTNQAYLPLGDNGQTNGDGSVTSSGDGGQPGDGTNPAKDTGGDGQRVFVTNWPRELGGSSTPGVKFSLFANGGIEDHTAHITDRLRVFGEPETGGEAYIPLSPSKRARSLAIWQQTGRRLGAYANGGISLPKIEAPKIEGPQFAPGGALPLMQEAPETASAQPAVNAQGTATFDGAQYTQQRLMQLGVDMVGIAKDAALQTLVPGGTLPGIVTNSIGLAKSVAEGVRTSQQNQASTPTTETTTSTKNGGQIVNNVTINATNTDDAFRQWQLKQNRDALGFEGKIP